jgi:hypothetical protein
MYQSPLHGYYFPAPNDGTEIGAAGPGMIVRRGLKKLIEDRGETEVLSPHNGRVISDLAT